MPEETTKTISIKKVTKKVEKNRWEKAWDKRRNNQIAAQQEQLSNSISYSSHKQWMTKKDNEIAEKDRQIADLEQQLAEQKSKKNNNQRYTSKNRK